MFTGIVEEVGWIRSRVGDTLTIDAAVTLGEARVGDSVAVNGACLTITSLTSGAFTVDISPETQRRTTLGALQPGSPLNLERPLPYGGRVGGHLVQGHIDGTGTVAAVSPEGDSHLFTFAVSLAMARYVAAKGFVAVDGVSLTAVEATPTSFTVAVIPYTHGNTVLGSRTVGDVVNIEVDIVAKYVERLLGQPVASPE